MAAAGRAETAVAVIGAGFISDYHVNGIRAAGGATVATLVGRDRARTEARARQLAVPRAETDRRVVLDDPLIDAVVIATPDDTHEALAIEALEAGKAVLLQKPMALTSNACRTIIDAAERTGTPLTVSFMHRYFPEVGWLRQWLAEGALGKIHAVRIRNATPGADWNAWFYAPGTVAGGVVMQLGVHGIDLCQHLFGPISEVSASLATHQPERLLQDGRAVRSTLEDNVSATYRFASGALGSHEMSYTEVAGCDRFRLEVYAEHGTVWLRTERGEAALCGSSLTGDTGWMRPELPQEPLGAVHHRHWLAIVRGDAPADDTAWSGLSTLVVGEHIYAAAREKRTLAIDAASFARGEVS